MADTKHKEDLDRVIQQNVKAIAQLEAAEKESRSRADYVADKIAGFVGTMRFAIMNAGFFALWVGWNLLAPKALRFDPLPFSTLTLVVSLQAIFLSIFILMSQNRQQRTAEKRNHLDLQINLLAEEESSLTLKMLHALMVRQGVTMSNERVNALEEATKPEKIAKHIEATIRADEDKPT